MTPKRAYKCIHIQVQEINNFRNAGGHATKVSIGYNTLQKKGSNAP